MEKNVSNLDKVDLKNLSNLFLKWEIWKQLYFFSLED